jgi:hypothetical protein
MSEIEKAIEVLAQYIHRESAENPETLKRSLHATIYALQVRCAELERDAVVNNIQPEIESLRRKGLDHLVAFLQEKIESTYQNVLDIPVKRDRPHPRELLLYFLRDRDSATFAEIAEHLGASGWSYAYARVVTGDLLDAGTVERISRGVYRLKAQPEVASA